MDFSDPSVIVVSITAGVAIVVALGLYFLSDQKLHLKGQETQHTLEPVGEIRSDLLDKLSQLGAVKDPERVAQAMTSFMNRELEKQKVTLTAQHQQALEKKQRELSAASEQVEKLGQDYKNTYDKFQRVTAEKTQTETIVRSMAEGLVVVNNRGEVLLMNPAAEKLLASDKKNKTGSLLAGGKENTLVSMVKNGAGESGKEIELLSEDDNTKKVLRASSAVIENESGQTIGMVSVLTDVTKQKEVEEMKTKFLATVSHELRTPLVTIQKAIALIHEQTTGPLNEAQEKFIDIAERNLQSLGRLINDLLDMQKLEAGKMEMIYAPAKIQDVVKTVVENLGPWAKTKSVKLKADVPLDLPETVMDAQRIGQVLINLIGNAIKFTPTGGTITASAKQKQGILEVSVADTGVGIAKEDLGKVFQRFQQVGERTASDIAGTGLGLSIAKEIAQLHGGTIWVDSEINKGTTFTFTLPLRKG